VAGPNEIAYLAQLNAIYDFFSLEMPVIFPRFGATIVEKKVSKILEKYKAEIHEFSNPEKLLKKLVKGRIDDVFNSFKSEVSRGMAEVTRQAESIDKTLIGSCSLARDKILKTIQALEGKITSKLKEHDQVTKQQVIKAYSNLFPYGDLQDQVTKQQVIKAYSNLFPYGDLQERHINVLEYLIKFGEDFLRIVYEDFLKADYGEHRVIKC